jgi:O-antigen/teichoic acid export membrane protein
VTPLAVQERASAKSVTCTPTRDGEAGRVGKTLRTHFLALADQAVVSGVSFLTLILVSHWTSSSQLGIYSIGISALISIIGLQDSLVLLPYIVERFRPIGTVAEHAGASLMQSGLLSVLSIALVAAAALSLSILGADGDAADMAWALVATIPFALLREFGRRRALARLRMGEAFVLDGSVAAIQVIALCVLGSTGWMTPATACGALGGACGLVGIVWLYLYRADFVIRKDQTLPAAKQNWSSGKGFLAAQVTNWLQSYVTYWLLALVHGSAATGVFAACMSLASFGNPLMMGINNALNPRAMLALETGGKSGLRRQAIQGAVLQAAAMGLFCLMLALFSADAMHLLYRGEDFYGQGGTVALLGVGLLALAVGSSAQFGLASLGRPRAIVRSASIGLAFTVFLGLFLMSHWNLFGAACGFAAGCGVTSAGLWVAFLARLRERDSRPDGNVNFGPNLRPMSVERAHELTPIEGCHLRWQGSGAKP